MRYGIAIDSALCMGCYNCYMACKDEHCGYDSLINAAQPQMGQFWMDIREWERGDSPRRIKVATVPTPCSHCKDAPCQKAAKNGAVYTREDGIVIIDPEKARGQKQLLDACPIGAIYWNEELQLPQKCTMCAELLDDPEYLSYLGDPALKQPRCVEACPNRALIFGDLDDPDSAISRKIAANQVTQLEPLAGIDSSVVHLNIPTVFLAGTVYLPDDEVAIGAQVTLVRREDGQVQRMQTNYFGDWEFEGLKKNAEYEITIQMPGYQSVSYTVQADTDHYVAETLLQPV